MMLSTASLLPTVTSTQLQAAGPDIAIGVINTDILGNDAIEQWTT